MTDLAHEPDPVGGKATPDNRAGLEMRSIEKSYGGVQALRGASLEARFGEIHGLVGENGAGKSTMVKVLSGAVSPDGGSIVLDGRKLELSTPASAVRAEIGTVFQELSLIPDLSVASNLFYDSEPIVHFGRVNQRALGNAARDALARFGIHERDVTRPVRQLRLGERQVLEIVKVLLRKPKVLLLDEATSALLPQQVDWLFSAVREFSRGGGLVLFISHRLDEIESLCDRITVFRNGLDVGTRRAGDFHEAELVEMMLGRTVQRVYPPRESPVTEDLVCQLHDFTSPPMLKAIDLDIHAGEIVGVAGLDGQGQGELFLALFGARSARGELRMQGERLDHLEPATAIAAGIGLVPEDRARDGLCLSLPIRDNLVLSNLRSVSRLGFISRSRVRAALDAAQRHLAIKFNDSRETVASLSGGNQQKVLLARVLACSPALLLMFDATRGVDIGTKSEIYGLMREQCKLGVGILFYSSDVAELVNMADRVVVLHDGEIREEMLAPLTEEAIVAAVVGGGGARD